MSSSVSFYLQAIERQVKQLRVIKDRTGWGPAAKVKLDLELAQVFHAVRKLARNGCLDLELIRLEFPTRVYAGKGKGTPDPGKSLKPYYVMKDPMLVPKTVEAICDLFADNAVFDVVQATDKRLNSVLVASESGKSSQLHEITISDILELLEEVLG